MTSIKDINYIRYGNKEGKTVVLLHGWGQNIEMMMPIGNGLKKDYDVIILDLPGFGKSMEPDKVLSIYDYAFLVHELLLSLNVDNPILVGHSFGGKVSIAYASKYDTYKLVLLASPFRKEIKKISFKTKLLKCIKKVPVLNSLEEYAKKHIGSVDYKNASPMMRKILVDHVNLDLTEDAKKIKCSTLIIWGTKDEAVSINDAYLLESLIKDAGVVVYEGCTHYAYLERLNQTINVLYTFLK